MSPFLAPAFRITEGASAPRAGTTRYRRGVCLYFAYISVATVLYALLVLTHMAREWLLAEWLINYQGGFVRRGLPGQTIYLLAKASHLSPAVWVVLGSLGLYAILLTSLFCLFLRAPCNYWVIALLVSPATLSFQILDVLAGFHKEVVYLAALCLFLILLRTKRLATPGAIAYLSVAIAGMTLSHEPLVCFMPYFLAALLLSGRRLPAACLQCLLPFALGFAIAAVCTLHMGSAATATRICASLGYPYLPDAHADQVCAGGAIGYLSSNAADAWIKVRADIPRYHYLPVYALLTLLSLAPIVAGSLALTRRGLRREMRVLWYTAAAAFLASLILFVYSVDWGRWIYVHTLSLTILLLYVAGRQPAAAPAPPLPRWKRRAAALLLLLYATTWTLPHFNENTPHYGYISLARFLETLPRRYAQRRGNASIRELTSAGVVRSAAAGRTPRADHAHMVQIHCSAARTRVPHARTRTG